MLGDESCIEWEERRVEFPKNSGDIEATIFSEGMVAVDEKDEERERDKESKPTGAGPGCWSEALGVRKFHF